MSRTPRSLSTQPTISAIFFSQNLVAGVDDQTPQKPTTDDIPAPVPTSYTVTEALPRTGPASPASKSQMQHLRHQLKLSDAAQSRTRNHGRPASCPEVVSVQSAAARFSLDVMTTWVVFDCDSLQPPCNTILSQSWAALCLELAVLVTLRRSFISITMFARLQAASQPSEGRTSLSTPF